jgi:D-glycero-alpha-D-manno-heptose-7-phosphate kinase
VNRVVARAPVRVGDLGGWTDTWFARTGTVCSVAVGPGAEVAIETSPARRGRPAVTLDVEQFGHRYEFDPSGPLPGRHPLLEHAVASATCPEGAALAVTLRSGMPPGSGVGTSAAVVVALLGALGALTGRETTRAELAAAAHRVESERLGLQSGVQDQIAAAYGGINRIDVTEYPTARVTPLAVAAVTRAELQRRLVHVYLGRPRSSSAVHDRVIAMLDREPAAARALEPLREAARAGADALVAGDLDGYGAALAANTEAQAALHADLVDAASRRVIALARAHGATGWKVNGAGAGGSVTVLGPSDPKALGHLIATLASYGPESRVLEVALDDVGFRVEPG